MTGTANESSYFVGKVVKAVAARYEAKMTEPPRRYTEDTLIADMLGAHKFATSEQERSILRETEGLGTSRTRASTIEGLKQGGFLVSKKKKKLFELTSSEVARSTLAHLPEMLTSVATTAKWEVAFKMIERGATTPAQVRQALKNNLDYIVQTAKSTGSIKMPAVSQSGGVPQKSRFPAVRSSAGMPQAQAPARQPMPSKAAASSAVSSPPAKSAGKGISSWFR